MKKLLLISLLFLLQNGRLLSQCNIGLEGAQINSTASGCNTTTMLLGSGAYRDILLAANQWYSFSWTNNAGGTTSGFCATIQSGGTGATSTSFSTAQTAWFSGSPAPVLRVSANRSSATWSATSATLTYSHMVPAITGNLTICGVGSTTDLSVPSEADWTLPTGGTITTSGNDYIHTFTSSGTFTTAQPVLAARALVIGGGGGAGGNGGGGGGAGGVVHNTAFNIASGGTTVTVGAGGTGGGSPAANGASSAFGSITASGGGGGASRDAGAGGQVGGSGGGGGGATANPRHIGGGGTAGQGNAGANGTTPDPGCNAAGGGGGGAGGAGTAGTSKRGGNGGAGIANNITGTSVTYAGGGGGGVTCNSTGAAGGTAGSGGGGAGGVVGLSAGVNGTANTGGGGGGGGNGAGSGGSGVVIVRYTPPRWTSSNTGVATVNALTGLVTAVAAGTTTITYTASSGCSVTAVVTVQAPSVAPTSVTGSGVTVCHGNTVNLTAAGGTLAAGASYEWFTGSCGGTAAVGTLSGTGNSSITVSPTATTTYYVRAGAGTSCPATACASGAVTLPTAGTALATSGQSATCNVSGNNWIHFYTSGGNLIASINPNGNNLGSVTATAYVGGGAALTQACGTGSNPSFTTAALGRSWLITPTNNLPASVRFPFAATELAALVTASATTTVNALDNVSGIGDLKMSHYSGPNNLNGSWSDNCTSAGGSGGTQLVGTQGGNGLTSTVNGFLSTIAGSSYVEFNTPGFSEFWLHGDGGTSPLPVQLINFSAACNEQGEVDLHWSTASEQNSQKFTAEKSRDLEHWTVAGERSASGNSNYKIDYLVTDSNAFEGVFYYRLVQTDYDGAQEVFGPVSVSCSSEANSMIVFPNPSKGSFTVEITSTENIQNAGVQLTDLTGKVISMREVNIFEGKNQLLFEEGLQKGTYIVKVASKAVFNPVKVVVE